MCRGFLLHKFWRILPGIFLEDFSGHFSQQRWGEKIRRQNPRKNPGGSKIKIREKSVLPKIGPNKSKETLGNFLFCRRATLMQKRVPHKRFAGLSCNHRPPTPNVARLQLLRFALASSTHVLEWTTLLNQSGWQSHKFTNDFLRVGCVRVYIYICAVELKAGPMFVFFSVKNWSKFFVFFCFWKSRSPCRKKRIFKKRRT